MSTFKHPDITNKPNHIHLDDKSVLIFEVSKQFMDEVKFYFSASMILNSKLNDVDRPPNPQMPKYNPANILKEFNEAWDEVSPRFIESLGQLFVSVERQSSSPTGVCLPAMKDLLADQITFALNNLIRSGDVCILFDLDVVKLQYNDSVKQTLPGSILEHLDKNMVAQENVYLVFLDSHYLSTQIGSHKDYSNDEKLSESMNIRSNLLRNAVARDSVFYTEHDVSLVVIH